MCINILFRHVCAEFGQLYQCRDYVPGPVKHGDSLQNYIPSCRNCFIYLTLYALYNTPAFLNIVPVNLAYNHPDSILYSWQNDKLLLYLMYIYMALVKHVCECWRKLKAWIMDGHGGRRNKGTAQAVNLKVALFSSNTDKKQAELYASGALRFFFWATESINVNIQPEQRGQTLCTLQWGLNVDRIWFLARDFAFRCANALNLWWDLCSSWLTLSGVILEFSIHYD